MKQVIVENIDKEELKELIREVIKPPPDPAILKILNSTVDRAYIKRNLRISHRQILNYEEKGLLIPVRLGDSEQCSAYYRLTDVIKLLTLKKI